MGKPNTACTPRRLLLGAAFCLGLAGPAHAETPTEPLAIDEQGNVSIAAQALRIGAEGEITITRGDTTLTMDKDGNVLVTSPGGRSSTRQGFQVRLSEPDGAAPKSPGVTLSGGVDSNANIELRNNGSGTPYIDFSQSAGPDHDGRIALRDADTLAVEGAKLVAAFQTEQGVSLSLPAGAVMAYGGNTLDPNIANQLQAQGWLPCDGRQVSRGEYAALFAAVGTAYGAGDGGSTFNVPDFRGRFLRGVSQGTGRDPDAGGRRSEPWGANGGDQAGSVQDDMFGRHSHSYDHFPDRRGDIASGRYWHSGGANTGEAGGNETRPKNVYVNWIIKAR